jgi:hypothetical protein
LGTVPYIEVDASLNSNLTIQVDGEHIIKSVENAKAIVFKGEGTYTICGQGTLTIEPQLVNIQGVISSESGNTSLTIKDLTINITTYGSADNGFRNINYSEINLDHCEINIKSGWCAWFGNSSNNSSANPVLKDCYLVNGVFNGGGVVEYVGSGEWMKEISIKRLYPVETLSYTVDQPTIGQPLHYTANANGAGYSMRSLRWWKKGGPNEVDYELEDGYIFKAGEIYKLQIITELYDGYYYADNVKASINGKTALLSDYINGMKQITYTFPQLANNYFDVWVGGKQVNDINKSDVLDDGGSVSFIKNVFGKYVLILENANITNTGDTQYDYTGYGRGIYSNLSGLTIRVKGNNTIDSKGEGIYFTGNLDISGSTDNQGKLSVKGSYGIRPAKSSTAITLDISRVELTAEGTSGTGIGGATSFSSNYNCTLKVGIANTVVMAKGSSVSLGNLNNLVFEDGLKIMQPTGAYFDGEDVRDASGNRISKQWVVIGKESSITTGEALPLNDNGEMINDKAGSWYTLDGRKLNGQPTKKGVYIHNGKTVIR